RLGSQPCVAFPPQGGILWAGPQGSRLFDTVEGSGGRIGAALCRPTPLFSERASPPFRLKYNQAGETVLAAGYTTGQLLILRKGVVAVAKEGVEIARVTDPGAVFRRNIRAVRSAALGRCARLNIRAVSRGRRGISAARPSRAPVRCGNPGTAP